MADDDVPVETPMLAPHIKNDVAPAKVVSLPVGQGVLVEEPSGQYEPGGQITIVGRLYCAGIGQ